MALSYSPNIVIRSAAFPRDTLDVQKLLRQYAAGLPNVVQQIIRDEGYFDEIDNVEKVWQISDETCFLVAFDIESREAIGCAALRPLKITTLMSGQLAESSTTRLIQPPTIPERCESMRLCELKRFFTTPSARGKGVGRMLLRAVTERARDLGYDEMRLDTSADLVAAIKAYQSVGFTQYARAGEIEHPVTIFFKLDLARLRLV